MKCYVVLDQMTAKPLEVALGRKPQHSPFTDLWPVTCVNLRTRSVKTPPELVIKTAEYVAFVCPGCLAEVVVQDKFCHECGIPLRFTTKQRKEARL